MTELDDTDYAMAVFSIFSPSELHISQRCPLAPLFCTEQCLLRCG